MLLIIIIPVVFASLGILTALIRHESPFLGAVLGAFWGPIGVSMLFIARRDRSRFWIRRRVDPDLPTHSP